MSGPDEPPRDRREPRPTADPRVLGQLLAAQNVLPVLPTPRHVADFYAGALALIPGVAATRVCFPGARSGGGARDDACAGCSVGLGGGADEAATLPWEASCQLAALAAVRVLPLQTATTRYGFFAIHVADAELFERYAPFVANLGNFLALSLENSAQRRSLQRRTEQLEAANRELEAFAYSASHDLRAPIRHVAGFAELLRQRAEAALDPSARHYLASISEAAGRMGRLIDDLLSFSRMGRAELAQARVDLGALVRDVIRELEPETNGREVRWNVADLPIVTGDRAMLRIALVNLLSNALKYTRPRPVAEIAVYREPSPASEVVVSVRDNGVGFDMAYAEKLFGVFVRLPHSSGSFEGTGIGLANVRRIVQRHGGRTWAKGEPDRGATFSFSLPHPPAAPG